MAGQEFKATEKTVLKHSRDGVVEKNLVDNSEKRVSKHTEEAVLKAETPSDLRFDKLQEAGIATPEPTKRKFSNLQFGRNNPENKWEEQRAEAKAEMSEQNLQPSEQISPSHKPRPPEQLSQTADYEFTPHSSEQFTTSEQPLVVTAQEFKESQDFNLKSDDTKPVSTLKEDKPTPEKRQFTENSPDEQYSTSDETVSVSADEFKDYGEDFNFKKGQPTDERSKDDLSLEKEEKKSKLKENKERNTLQEHSSAAEKLTDDNGESALNFEGEAQAEAEPIADKKTRKLEKKVEKAEKRLSKLEEKNDKKLPKLVKKDEKRVYKLDKRIAKAESRLSQKRVLRIRKEYNSDKLKVQRKIVLEKEVKPLNSGGVVTRGIKKANSMVALSVNGAVHKEIGKYEEDNQTLKAAHGTEKVAESALHFTKESIKTHHQRLKEKPHEKVSKLKFQRETTAQKLNEHKAMTNNKKLRKDENSARKTLKNDRSDIENHNGIFGVEVVEWERYQAFEKRMDDLAAQEPSREALLLNGKECAAGIYQLNSSPENRDIRFADSSYLESKGIVPDRDNYTLVYSFPVLAEDLQNKSAFLEQVFEKFNIDHPKDFAGHSLSVSDVVVIQQNGELSAHYVDRAGFTELANFGAVRENPLKAVEDTIEQNDNSFDGVINNTPSMDELEARAMRGEQVSVSEMFDAAKAEHAKKQPDVQKPEKKAEEKRSIRKYIKQSQAKKPEQSNEKTPNKSKGVELS